MLEERKEKIRAVQEAQKKIIIALSIPATWLIMEDSEKRLDQIRPIERRNGNQ